MTNKQTDAGKNNTPRGEKLCTVHHALTTRSNNTRRRFQRLYTELADTYQHSLGQFLVRHVAFAVFVENSKEFIRP